MDDGPDLRAYTRRELQQVALRAATAVAKDGKDAEVKRTVEGVLAEFDAERESGYSGEQLSGTRG